MPHANISSSSAFRSKSHFDLTSAGGSAICASALADCGAAVNPELTRHAPQPQAANLRQCDASLSRPGMAIDAMLAIRRLRPCSAQRNSPAKHSTASFKLHDLRHLAIARSHLQCHPLVRGLPRDPRAAREDCGSTGDSGRRRQESRGRLYQYRTTYCSCDEDRGAHSFKLWAPYRSVLPYLFSSALGHFLGT
jgi:hypothetical protein